MTDIETLITKEKQELDQLPSAQPITNKEELDSSVNLLGMVKDKLKYTECNRKEMTEHLVKQKKIIDDKFKQISIPLESLERALKIQIQMYYDREHKEAMAKLQQAKEEGTKAVVAIEAPASTIRTGSATASIKKVWTFTIEDTSQIPLEYMIPDDRKIREAISVGKREIPGINIHQVSNVSIR